MGISLAPEQAADNDLLKPKKPVPLAAQNASTASTAATPGVGLAQIPSPTIAAPSAPVDRVKLATDIFNTTAASTQGAYDATRRENVRGSAALGQIASGGLRTREGNLQLARGRDLDQMRERLVNSATEGSIADASTAYQQQLASSQQGLAAELGRGSLDVSRGGLELEKERFATGAGQTQQQIDLAKKQQEINTAFETGRMTLAEKNLQLAELSNSQQFGLEGQRLDLAKEGQAASIRQSQAALALQEKLGLGGLSAEQQRIAIAQKQQEIEQAYQMKQISLAERNMALNELAQSQGHESEQERIGLAREQLAQTGQQFGLSLAQQKELATLADKTSNRQLDISSTQGRNMLLLELARIMGGPSGNVDPNFLATVARALGMSEGGTPRPGAPGGGIAAPAGPLVNPLPLGGGGIGLEQDRQQRPVQQT